MSAREYVYVLANAVATPAAAATALFGSQLPLATDLNWAQSLLNWDFYQIEVDITAGTGGTTGITLDRSFDNGTTWREFWRSADVAATTTAHFSTALDGSNTVTAIGTPATGTTAPVIAASACAGGRPGPLMRARVTAGVGTTVAGVASVRIVASKKPR